MFWLDDMPKEIVPVTNDSINIVFLFFSFFFLQTALRTDVYPLLQRRTVGPLHQLHAEHKSLIVNIQRAIQDRVACPAQSAEREKTERLVRGSLSRVAGGVKNGA